MNGFRLVYALLSLIIIIYSVRHRLDLLCVGTVCYIVYSMYCLYGIGIAGQYRPTLSPTLYYCVYTQLILIVGSVALFRHFSSGSPRLEDLNLKELPAECTKKDKILNYSFRIYTIIIVAFAAVNVISIGLSGFSAGKATVWEESNILYIISLYGAYPSFAYGIHNKDKLIWIPSLLIELTIFFAGSRAFATTLIVIFLCEKGTMLWKNRKSSLKIFVLGAVGIVFLLVYRTIDRYVMAGDISGAIHILKDSQTWLTALEFNEPRVIIANYDYVITSGIRLPFWDILYRIFDFVPGLTSIFKIPLAYPDYFSDWLMEEVQASTGVGGTIWGEGYAMFGYVGVILLTVIWLIGIKKANDHLDYHKPYSYFIVSVGTYLSWYINRLDFNRVAQACKVTFFCFLIWLFIFLVLDGEMELGNVTICRRRKLKGKL